jgi:hypothetical protein
LPGRRIRLPRKATLQCSPVSYFPLYFHGISSIYVTQGAEAPSPPEPRRFCDLEKRTRFNWNVCAPVKKMAGQQNGAYHRRVGRDYCTAALDRA